jgi:hypothetical protein
MKNKILYIVGAVALLGGGVFLFLKNKKSKEASILGDVQKATEIGQAPAQTTPQGTSQIVEPIPVKTAIEPLNFLQQIRRKEAQRILDWVTRSKPSIAETAVKFQKIKTLGFNVVGDELVPLA